MSDLGDIKYTNVNQGTRPVGDEGLSEGVGRALQFGKQLRDQFVVDETKKDMLSAIAVAQEDSAVVEVPIVEYPAGSRENTLLRRMNELEAVMAQGNTSQRGLAEATVKNIMTEAELKYPRLAAQLRQSGMQVLSANAGLERLGIDDKLRTVEAEKASDMRQAIIDKGQAKWPDGYAIEPSIDPRSAEWAALYEQGSIYDRVINDGARRLAIMTANAQIDADTNMPKIMEELQGKYSLVDAKYQHWANEYQLHDVWNEVAKGEQADLNLIQNWQTVHGQQLKEAVIRERALIQDAALKVLDPSVEGFVPAMQKYRDRFDDLLAEMDQFVRLIDSSAESLPSALQQMETQMTIRGNTPYFNLVQSDPEHATVTAFMSHGQGRVLSEIAANLPSTNGIQLANHYNMSIQSSLAKMYPGWFKQGPGAWAKQNALYYGTTGALQIPTGASAAAVEQAMLSHLMDGTNSFVVPTSSDEEKLVSALLAAETHYAIWDTATRVVPQADEYADNALLGLAYSLTYLNNHSRKPEDATEEIMGMLGDSKIDKAVTASLKNSEDVGKRQAFAKQAEQFYLGSKPLHTRQEMFGLYQGTKVGGQDLPDLAKIDVEALEKGEFGWIIQPAVLERAAQRIQQQRMASRQSMSIETARSLAEQDINSTMSTIREEVNKQVSIERTLNKAKADNPDSLRQEDSFAAIFKGVGDPDEKRAWAHGFEYATRTATKPTF